MVSLVVVTAMRPDPSERTELEPGTSRMIWLMAASTVVTVLDLPFSETSALALFALWPALRPPLPRFALPWSLALRPMEYDVSPSMAAISKNSVRNLSITTTPSRYSHERLVRSVMWLR
jgi:hypothetical protein